MRGEELDRIPNAPRIFSWLAEHLGRSGVMEYVRLAEEMPYDPLITITDGPPNLLSHDGDYSRLPEVSAAVARERGDDCEIVTRVLGTPAGELRDRYVLGDPGSRYGTSANPHRLEHFVKDRSDLTKLRYLFPDPQAGDYPGAARYQEQVGDLALLEMRPSSRVDQNFVDALGIDNGMVLLYDDREFFDDVLHFFHEHHLAALHRACHSDIQVIYGSWFNFSLSAGWSPAIYREAFLPMIEECIELVHEHGMLYHFYDDGRCMELLEDWAALGPDCISTLCPPPMGDVDIAEAKRMIGAGVCLKGNIDLYNVIMRGRPEEIREAVRGTLQVAAPGGRLILSTNDSIRNGTPTENVRAYMAAGREYGATYL
jgi:hypothetical protein